MAPRILSIEYLAITSLQLDPQDPLLHTSKQIRQLANSRRTLGFDVPILVNAQRRVVAGYWCGDTVLEPFLGSGTTVVAAEHTGCVCYGIDLDRDYVDTIVRRWQIFTGQSVVRESTGRTFNEMIE